MNTPRWERAKDIFDSALDLPDGVRASYLSQSCGDDAELRREVEGLLAADAEASGFMNPAWLAPFSPFVAEAEFQLVAGDVVSGRFKIVRSLGDGGMGRVYEAHDSMLGVQVALKTLRPEISANPEVLFRFRQEVRIAHRITHPNVCRTYHLDHELRHIGPDDSSSIDVSFLTMEYLEGETLQQLLNRSERVPLERALHIARQMADAIAAAHEIGVIHRDIKPSNVMICPPRNAQTPATTDRVVMTDFGLAKFEAGARNNDLTSMSQPGRAMGTLAYMSPEQLQGKGVGAPSDIYAFGLVLYEMVTGVKAFPNSETMEAAYRRVIEAPPSPRTLAPALPDKWNEAVLGCLQIDPAARFQQATDVVAVLEGRLPRSSYARSSQQSALQRLSTLSRRKVATISLFVACVALSSIGLRYFSTRGDAAVAPGALVYLAPVKNETGEKLLDSVTELVQAGLEQSSRINLLDAGKVGDTLQHMTKPPDKVTDATTAREIAMRAGAARVVFITLTSTNKSYQMDVEIQQPDNTPERYRDHWIRSFNWTNTAPPSKSADIPLALLTQVRSVSDWIRSKAGESANDIARLDAPPEDATTNSWLALQDFTEAQEKFRTSHSNDAITLLRSAITLDPHFCLAYALLGDVLYADDQAAEGNRAYRNALELDGQRRISLRERDRIQGIIAQDTLDFQSASQAYREYTLYYPNDYFGWFRLARPLLMLGRTQESIDALLQAHKVGPDKAGAVVQLVRGYLVLQDKDNVNKWLEVLRKNYSRDDYLFALGPVQFVDEDTQAAELTFKQLSTSSNPAYRDAGIHLLADLYAEQGNNSAAEETLTYGINRQPRSVTLHIARAEVECASHDVTACLNDMDRALDLEPGPNNVIKASEILGREIANANAAESRALRSGLDELRTKGGEQFGLVADLEGHLLNGELLLAHDRPDAAVVEFRKAAMLDAPINPKEYLARALAAQSRSGALAVQSGLRESASLYRATAEHPERIWWFAPGYLPGSYADSLCSLLRLETTQVRSGSDRTALAQRLARLRPHSPTVLGLTYRSNGS